MARLFKTFRSAIFVAALVCSVIVLGVAAFLSSILESNELTHFISFALGAAAFSVPCISAIIFFSARERDRFISQTRCEVSLGGGMAVVWAALAFFMAFHPVPHVDCLTSSQSNSQSYTTEEFQAQYRALEAFALLVFLLLAGWTLFILILAVRHTLAGRKQVWNARVDEAPWFPVSGIPGTGFRRRKSQRSGSKDSLNSLGSDSTNEKDDGFTRLPLPVTAYTTVPRADIQRTRSKSSSVAPPIRNAVVPSRLIATTSGLSDRPPAVPSKGVISQRSPLVTREVRSRPPTSGHARSASTPVRTLSASRDGRAGVAEPGRTRRTEEVASERRQPSRSGITTAGSSARPPINDAIKGVASARARGWQ